MNEDDIIVGLDIGTTKIACFIGQQSENGKVKILGYGKYESIGVAHGVVLNIKSTADSITKAVEMASDQANVNVEEVYVGIAGQHIKSITSQGQIMIPPEHDYIQEDDVERLIEEQHHILLGPGEDIIHVFPQTYIVDGEELSVDPVGVAGKQLKATFHIVTGNHNNLNSIKLSVERAGLRIKGVVLEPIASAYAVLDDNDKAAGVALVDIGGGTTDIAIFYDGIIRHTSVLPLAGNVITNDIKENCKIMKPQAESLKTRFGSCLPETVNENDIVCIPGIRNQPPREIGMKTLAGIIKARTVTILEQVDYEIKVAGYQQNLIGGVVLTGGGANLKNIKELAEFTTKTDTRIGYPDEHLEKDAPEELKHPMYATGIGLVLYGLEQNRLAAEPQNESDPIFATPTPQTPDPVEPPIDFDPRDEAERIGEDKPKETRHEKREKRKKEENKDTKKKGFIDSINKYFGDVFNGSGLE